MPPHVNSYRLQEVEEAAREDWNNWLQANQAFIQRGDVVFYRQDDYADWNHAALVVEESGPQTYYDSDVTSENIRKPLVVEHSGAFQDKPPRAIDNTGSRALEITVVHIW